MSKILIEKDFDNKSTPQYLKEFETFYNTWLMNKYVGVVLKTLDIIVMKDLM